MRATGFLMIKPMIVALLAASPLARADCDLRFAPPEVQAAAKAHRPRREEAFRGSGFSRELLHPRLSDQDGKSSRLKPLPQEPLPQKPRRDAEQP